MSKLYKTNQDSLKSVNIIKSENTYSISEADKKSLTSPVSLEVALIKLQRQLIIENKRPRTIESYMKWSNNFFDFCRDRFDAYYTDELSPQMLYDWLSIMDVKETTKNIRLKSVKSMLSRCNNNGWIFNNWWKQIQIKVDDEVKEATREIDIQLALNTLDLSNFFELRDAVAILLVYETGMRNSTFAQLRECHIDFSNKLFVLPPAIMKGRRSVVLPLSANLAVLIEDLIEVNNRIRKTYNQFNDFIFINRLGRTIHLTGHSNVIQKRLIEIEKKTGIKNLSPHSLRRAYATNLYRKGASIPIISKALGHSDFSITHKYLYLDKNEVAEELRKYNEL